MPPGLRGPDWAGARLLEEAEEFVRDLDVSFSPSDGPGRPYNNLGVYNLLNSHYPGPRQYEKYREGTGIGQYERSS